MTKEQEPARPERAPLLALGLFTLAVLGLEVFLTRLLAYTVDTFLIYVVLGIAMTGFGAAGTLVTLRARWLETDNVPRALAGSAIAFVVALVFSYAAFVRLAPLLPFGIGWVTFAAASLLTLPFLAAGIVVTLALASAGPALGRVYAADLIGSGLGCFVPLYLLGPLDGGRFLAVLALVGWFAAWLFVRRVSPVSRVLSIAAWTSFALALMAFALAPQVFPVRPDPYGQVGVIQKFADQRGIHVTRLYDRWNMTGRIEIFEYRGVRGAPDPYPFRFYAQDNTAGAIMARWDGRDRTLVPPGRVDSTEVASMCSDTLFGQAYYAPRKRALVIGVGGGADVQCALYHGVLRIDAVEINPATIAAIKGPFDEFLGGIGTSSRVSYHLLDGRSFARAARGRGYDLVQLSGVDTKSIIATGALALSENHLYTREAFVDYLSSLHAQGALSLIRFGEPEALRLVATGIAALGELGERSPVHHILVARNGPAYGVIITRKPLGATELAAYREQLWFADRPFRGVAVVFLEPFGYVAEQRPELQFTAEEPRAPSFASYALSLSRGQVHAFQERYPWNVSPATDDRPFFFDTTRYDLPQARAAPHVIVLSLMVGSVLLLAVSLIVLPLVRIGRSLRGGAVLTVPLYFVGVGIGYLLVEIWFLHRFAMFLGHQSYALSVVLATLLASTGIGAALARRVAEPWRRRAVIGILFILGLLTLEAVVLPRLLDTLWTSSLGLRVLVTIVFVLPAGLAMGFPFPAGLDWVAASEPRALPWCIGINFFASVVATVAAIPLALFYGYSALLGAGMAFYVLSLLVAPLLRARVSSSA